MILKYYYCTHCGKIVAIINDSDVPTMCCGDAMILINPNSSDGDKDKHIPIVTINDKDVEICVSQNEHPMTYAHYIKWIVLQTNKGIHKRYLSPMDKPKVAFVLTGDEKSFAVYAYCNLHGLWETKLKI